MRHSQVGSCCSAKTYRIAPAWDSGEVGRASHLRKEAFVARFRALARPRHGEVAEWLKAPHSKCGILARVSGVRIPPSPPRPDCSHEDADQAPGIAAGTAGVEEK